MSGEPAAAAAVTVTEPSATGGGRRRNDGQGTTRVQGTGKGTGRGRGRGRGRGNNERERKKSVVPGFIDQRLTNKNLTEQHNAVWGIANWYKTLLVAVNWTAFKKLNDDAVKLHVPLELERMVRDIYSSQKRIVQYYDASKEMYEALVKLNVKNQTGYFTDADHNTVKLDDPTLTTKLFLANQLLFGNRGLRATMSLSPNRSQLRKSALQFGMNNHVRVSNVMTRIDYDEWATAFYAHFESFDSPGEFVVSVQFHVKPEGVFEVGVTRSYQEYLEKARGVPLVTATAEYMRHALGYTARPSAHALAGDYSSYDATYARGGGRGASGRGRGRGRG